MRGFSWRTMPLIFIIVMALFFWRALSINPHYLPLAQINKPIPVFKLPLLLKPGQLTEKNFKQQMVLLNIWASWCESCKQEQLFLIDLAKKIPIIAINYKDSSTNAQKFLQDWGNPFTLIAQDAQGKFAIELGVYGTPETFLIDAHGIIRYRYPGVLNQTIWQQQFLPIIKKLSSK